MIENTRFLDGQKARFEKSKDPVIKKRHKAIERFKKLSQEFNAELKYYDAQLVAIDNAIASLYNFEENINVNLQTPSSISENEVNGEEVGIDPEIGDGIPIEVCN